MTEYTFGSGNNQVTVDLTHDMENDQIVITWPFATVSNNRFRPFDSTFRIPISFVDLLDDTWKPQDHLLPLNPIPERIGDNLVVKYKITQTSVFEALHFRLHNDLSRGFRTYVSIIFDLGRQGNVINARSVLNLLHYLVSLDRILCLHRF